MLSKSKNHNPNYLAKIVKLTGIQKHPNADKLQTVVIDFQTVITGLTAVDGDIYVYFPVESALNKEFLSSTNSFRDKDLNVDNEKGGFFEKNRRVKATKLKGIVSNGYIVPIEDVTRWSGCSNKNIKVGQEFDTINGKLICEKYTIPVNNPTLKRNQGKKPKENKIIAGQFHFHVDTLNFRRNAFNINPEDLISLSYKMHGTNFVYGNVLTKKKLSWKNRIAKWLGANVITQEYSPLYSSRRVIKNPELGKNHSHYYSEDIWGLAVEKFELNNKIPKGFSIYGELVGYIPNGSFIQADYDYGCEKEEFQLYVFRVTFTNPDGIVTELNQPQIVEFCQKAGLKHTPCFYFGKAKDLYPNIVEDKNWNEQFIKKLEQDYIEKDCFMCRKKVPEEGIVIRKEILNSCEVYKLKSVRFLEKETKLADKGVINIDDKS